MPRYKLVIEYDGGPFSGWQRQLNGPSVQQSVEEAVEAFCGHPVRLHCAGRTDAGVHATHQVAHVELEREWRTDVVRDASNAVYNLTWGNYQEDYPVAHTEGAAVGQLNTAVISAVPEPASVALLLFGLLAWSIVGNWRSALNALVR